jgi:hypothetical protein
LRFFFVIAPGPVERHRVGRSISCSIRSFTSSTVKRLLPCTVLKTDWEGLLDAAVAPVCVDALAVRPRDVRYSPQSGHSSAQFVRPLSASNGQC